MNFARKAGALLRAAPIALLVGGAPLAAAHSGGTWTDLAPMALARQEVGAARIGGRVFVVGGLVAGFPPLQATASVEVYDAAAGTWSSAAPLPLPLDHMAVAASGGLLYVAGGYSADFQARDELWIYDPAADAWSAGPPLPARRGACWAAAHGGRIFVFGGKDAAGVTRASTFVYDTATSAWSQGADMPTAREHLNAVALGDSIYVIGGRDGAASAANERYDPATNSWTVLAPLPTARSATATESFAGRIFVMGGEIPLLHAVNEVYDPATDRWSRQASMPLPRHGVACVALDERILVAAGGTVQGLAPTDHVDSFVPAPAADFRSYCACAAGAPCGNHDAAAGCANSTGSGALLAASGSSSAAADDLAFGAHGLLPAQPALLFVGEALVAGGAGLPFGDGLRCAGTNVVRLGVGVPDAMGDLFFGPGLGSTGGWSAGSARYFQVWYRDPSGPCASTFNLTQGVEVLFGT